MAGVLTPGTGNDFRYKGVTDSGAPATGSFTAGDWVEDGAGGIQLCTVAGTPGTWASLGSGGGGSGGVTLVPTAVKTTNYTAAVSDFVPVDTTSGAVTVTLPTAPADKTTIGVKLVTLGAGNFVTVALGGSDVMNKTGGSTTRTLKLLNEAAIFQYKAAGAIWYTVAADKFQLTPSTDLPAVTGTPSASTYLRGDNSWAAPTATADASALQYIDAITQGMVADARTTADGVIAGSSTTLTSATAVFVVGDVGKTVNLSENRVVLDAAITSGAATLTSATAAFTADDVGKTVLIDGAGATGFAKVATISAYTNATTVTINSNASTTVSAKTLTISAVHQTTIASRTNATTVVLTAAPTFGFTAANLVLGTPNRAAFAAAVAAAVAAQKPLWIPTGKYLIESSEANKNAMTASTTDLTVLGAGRDLTRLIMVSSDQISSASRTLFNLDSNATAPVVVELRDMTLDYVGPIPNLNSYGPYCIQLSGNLAGYRAFISNVDANGWPQFIAGQGGTGTTNTRRIWLRNVQAIGTYIQCALFTAVGAGVPYDAELHIHDTRLENTTRHVTQTNDNGFNAHIIYIHPTVSLDVNGLVTKSVTTATSMYHIHCFGSPTENVKFWSIRRMRTDQTAAVPSAGTAILCNPNGGPMAMINDCDFFNVRVGLSLAPFANVTVDSCTFTTLGASVVISASTASSAFRAFRGCTFYSVAMLSAYAAYMVNPNSIGSSWTFDNCWFLLANNGAGCQGAIASGGGYVSVRDSHVVGATGNTSTFTALTDNAVLLVDGCRFTGAWGSSIVTSNLSTDDLTDCVFNNNTFAQTSGRFSPTNSNFRNGNLRGADNTFPSNALGPGAGASGSGALVAPRRKNQTAIASASTINPDWNHDSFDVSGTTAVDNIQVGDSANSNRHRGGDLYLQATGAWTLKNNSGGTGNIRTQAGADRVMVSGQVVHLRADEKNGLWYEIA